MDKLGANTAARSISNHLHTDESFAYSIICIGAYVVCYHQYSLGIGKGHFQPSPNKIPEPTKSKIRTLYYFTETPIRQNFIKIYHWSCVSIRVKLSNTVVFLQFLLLGHALSSPREVSRHIYAWAKDVPFRVSSSYPNPF
jgi:hypothetical protein